MNLQLKFKGFQSYSWSSKNGVFVLGYLFLDDNRCIEGDELLTYCSSIKDKKTFQSKILDKKGNFSIVIQGDRYLFAAVDSIRTFPVFYFTNGQDYFITDAPDSIDIENGIELDNGSIKEFLSTGFVTGNRTLLKNVYQLQAGEMICLDMFTHVLNSNFYSNYKLTSPILNKPYTEQKKILEQKLEVAFNRMFMYVNNRPIVVPLSGGYDSRLIVSILKKWDYKNVICYTYGARDSHEVKISKKVAHSLGYKWLFIEYNKETIKENYIEDDNFKQYYKYASKFVSAFLLQDFFAIQYIKEKKLIPDNSIIVPGHSADFLAGSHLTRKDIKNKCREFTIKKIFLKHYILNGPHNMCRKVNESLSNEVATYEYSIDDNWNLKERQSKFIVNSVRIYEFFGYQHYLPFWDVDLQEFFKKLNPEYKLNCFLYEDLLFENYFNKQEIGFRKNKNFIKDLAKNVLPQKIRQSLAVVFKKDFNKTNLASRPFLGLFPNKQDNINKYVTKWYINQLLELDN